MIVGEKSLDAIELTDPKTDYRVPKDRGKPDGSMLSSLVNILRMGSDSGILRDSLGGRRSCDTRRDLYGLGAYDSATNPHASQQAAQEYQNVSSQLASIHQNSFEPAYIKNASSAGK